MGEELTSVNAEQASDEGLQESTAEETVNAVEGEVATPKAVTQTPEQNAEYAKVRREAESKARDATIAELGYEYDGKPITTYAEYQNALAEIEAAKQREQFQEQNGFDPDSVKPLFEQWKEQDPDFQELRSIKAEKNIAAALSELNQELADAGIDLKLENLSDAELQKIPNTEKVTEYVQKGHTLADAFFLANKKDIIAKQTAKTQQETIKKISANGESTPGALAGGGENDVYFTKEQVDGMSISQVKSNYDAIMKSQKKWYK